MQPNYGFPEPVKRPQRKAVSVEPIESQYQSVNSQPLISSAMTRFFPSFSLTDQQPVLVQQFTEVAQSEQWIRRWNEIHDITSYAPNGVLHYSACHITKRPDGNGSDVYWVAEPVQNSLRNFYLNSFKNLPDIVNIMYQVSETLCELSKHSKCHQCINPDTILIKHDPITGRAIPQLSTWVGDLKIGGLTYDQRPEYSIYIAPDYSSMNHLPPINHHPQMDNHSRNDVYALGITILELIGVSESRLMDFKTRSASEQTLSAMRSEKDVESLLKYLLLKSVSPSHLDRPSITFLRDRFREIINRADELGQVNMGTLAGQIEDLNLSDQKSPQPNHQPIVSPLSNFQIGGELIPTGNNDVSPDTASPFPLEVANNSTAPTRTSSRRGTFTRLRTLGRGYTLKSGIQGKFELCASYLILLLVFAGVLLTSVIMGIHYTGVPGGPDIRYAVQGVYENVNFVPIIDITFASTSGGCPTDFEFIPSLGYWPGTKTFCYDLGFIQMHWDDCWYHVYTRQGQHYVNWKGQYICVKRLPGFTNSTTCPSGSTQCAPGVCTTGTVCPITTLELSTTAKTTDGWSSTASGDGRYFNYRQDTDAQPVATFRLTIAGTGEKTCLSLLEYPRQNDYTPIQKTGNDCADFGTLPGSVVLDTDSSAAAEFSYQTWGSDILGLPKFGGTLEGESAYLTVSPRLELNSNCYEIDFAGLYFASTDIQTTRNITKIFTWILIFATCFMFLMVLLILCAAKSNKNDDMPWIAVLYKLLVGLCAVIYSIIGILLIIVAALTAYYESEVGDHKDEFSLVESGNCFADSNVNSIIADFSKAVVVAEQVQLAWLGFTVIHWAILLLIFLFWWLAARK